MPKILAIETSTNSGSVALLEDGDLIGEQFYHLEKSHSSLLHTMIEQLMSNVGKELADVDAFALAKGPGSYTGLRIGTSSAKGLCYALDKPLIGINTLESMANQVLRYNQGFDYYCPMIDARRMEVYTLVKNNSSELVLETEPVILEENSFKDFLDRGKVLFFGDGSDKFKPVTSHPNAYFLDHVVPRAHDVALLAEHAFEQSAFENMIDFEPFYLKEFRTTTPKK